MNDEKLYLDATNEAEGKNRNAALWAKVMALSDGDQKKAKYSYIKIRVEQLNSEQKVEQPKFARKTIGDFDFNYMPIDEFSKIKSIPETKIIEMIRDGFYVGQVKNDSWYVSRDEVEKENVLHSPQGKHSSEDLSKEKKLIPVEEFAELKGITSEKAIDMIRDGFYEGQKVDDKWNVFYSEVGSTSEFANLTPEDDINEKKNSVDTLGIASMILGIIGLFFLPILLSPIALVLGIMAKKPKSGFAIAGIVIGGLGSVLALIGLLVGATAIAILLGQS